MRFPPLGALRAFEAAARLLSLSRAGDELNVTHAAISHQIHNLEDWFGAPLFRREGRGIRLTTPGQELFNRMSPLFQSMADACKTVKAMSGAEILTVGCVPSVASRWLAPNLAEFSAQHPLVDIRVVYAKPSEQLSSADLDVLITNGDNESKGVVTRRLFSRVNKPVCSPQFLRRNGSFHSPEEIIAMPLLHDENREGWHDWCQIAGLTNSKALSGPVYQDSNLLAAAVIAGHGVALCPINVFRAEINRGDLIIVSDLGAYEDEGYYIKFRENRTAIADKFVEWFFMVAGQSCAFEHHDVAVGAN
ncbi:LysR family transcriptional regulator [Paraburkholderia sp. UYCP14C]|uniref:LysR substrate-binding domain-containing protein n=1 Tax=Paraburkholderia sp. UYCP14C TaxID=2511130 RepID=UPI00101F8FD0|nr:LysR substrate-binding domain-containing protein [Paraburkholderia sp. UYCP14C]RZF24214.1 LysR family transcriptional regulator [Paraburkholderia sp. UYCP14C]